MRINYIVYGPTPGWVGCVVYRVDLGDIGRGLLGEEAFVFFSFRAPHTEKRGQCSVCLPCAACLQICQVLKVWIVSPKELCALITHQPLPPPPPPLPVSLEAILAEPAVNPAQCGLEEHFQFPKSALLLLSIFNSQTLGIQQGITVRRITADIGWPNSEQKSNTSIQCIRYQHVTTVHGK